MFAKLASVLVLGLVCCIATGCSMCCGLYDYHYPVVGGKHQRTNPEYGRVGSIYSDPTAGYGSTPLTNADVPDDSPGPININEGDEDQDNNDLDMGEPEVMPTPEPNQGSGVREIETSYGRPR